MDGKIHYARTMKVSVPANSSEMVYSVAGKDILCGAAPQEAYTRFTYTDSEGKEYSNLRFFINQRTVDFLDPQICFEVTEKSDYKEVKITSEVFSRAVYLSV